MPVVRAWPGRRAHRPAPHERVRGLSTDGEVDPRFEDLDPAEIDQVVAPALELAVMVARFGAQARPPLAIPRSLRPLARFARLPASARATVRRAIDDDDDFRERISVGADEAGLPRPAWLFLRRPEGWREELTSLVRQRQETDRGDDRERELRRSQRRVEVLEASVLKLEAALAVARREAALAATELSAVRPEREEHERERAELLRRVASLEVERDRVTRRAEALEATVDEQRAQLEGLGAVGRPGAAASERADATDGDDVPATGRPRVPPTPSRAERAESARRRSRSGRVPTRLPSGTRDDSTAAASHLVRVPGMVVLVDGYNATLGAWPDLPIATQRSRLLDACGELGARTGAEVMVVFDGTEPHGPAPDPPGRRKVRWRFSPPEVEADDVLLGLVDDLDATRPVTVASDDRRVREGAIGRGANVISTAQLFSVLRRERPGPST